MRYEKRKESIVIFIVVSLGAIVASVPLFGNRSNYALIAATAFSAIASMAAIMLSQQLEKKRKSKRIFIVYAREDVEVALGLEAALRKDGFNPWLDINEIIPGQLWQKVVLDALEESAVALVLVSKNLFKKGFVQTELDAALKTLQENDKQMSPVIPVRLDDSEVPESLKNVQWVNLFEENGMERLIAGLKRGID